MGSTMDRKALSKSAPSMGRRASKDKTKKQTTMREITTWIDKGDGTTAQGAVKGSRNVGMLTENVTEQRLLYTRQLELGRERYKFLASHSYEKQKFVEHQNRKNKSMKKMMHNARRIIETTHTKPDTPRRTITVRIPQMEEIKSPTSGEPVEEIPLPATKVDSRPSSLRTKPPEDRPTSRCVEEKKTVHFPKPVKSGKRPVISGRALYIDLSRNFTETRKPQENEKQNEKLPVLQKSLNRQITFNSRINSAASKSSGKDTTATADSNKQVSVSLDAGVVPKPEVQEEKMSKWRLRSRPRIPQFGQKFHSSVGDPRYVALTNTLVPCDDLGKPVISVEDVIAKKDILRSESKCERNTRAKQLHARFIAYLLEQELRR